MYSRRFYKIISKICDSHNIAIRELVSGNLIQIIYNNQIEYIYSHRFPLNNETSGRIMDDKYHCSTVLKLHGIPVVPCKLLKILDGHLDEVSRLYVKKELDAIGKIVIKPNDGLQGVDVYCCESIHDVETVIAEILKSGSAPICCPYIKIKEEYRLIYLDEECLLCYRKVPQKNEWRHNLSLGAVPCLEQNLSVIDKLQKIAISAGRIVGCRCSCVDIIETIDECYMVLEMNTGITMDKFMDSIFDGETVATNIYDRIISKMFKI